MLHALRFYVAVTSCLGGILRWHKKFLLLIGTQKGAFILEGDASRNIVVFERTVL